VHRSNKLPLALLLAAKPAAAAVAAAVREPEEPYLICALR